MALTHVTERFGTKGSTVQVNLAAGGAASLFSDAAGVTPLPNPVTVSANGHLDFYVASGSYVLTESGNGTDKRTITVGSDPSIVPGSEIASAPSAASFTPGSNAVVDVTGWSVMVPANSGNVLVWCPSGVSLTAVTGTNPATTQQRVSVYITNDLGVQVAFASWVFYGTGATQTLTNHVAIGALVPNDAADRTYRVQVQVNKLGTLGATGSINAGGIFPNLALQAVRR